MSSRVTGMWWFHRKYMTPCLKGWRIQTLFIEQDCQILANGKCNKMFFKYTYYSYSDLPLSYSKQLRLLWS